MASIDIKDAYYSVPVADSDKKYLKFEWHDTLYKFSCFPNASTVPEEVHKTA